MQAQEITEQEAAKEAPGTALILAELAASHRNAHRKVAEANTRKHWVPSAGTYCYETHIAIPAQSIPSLKEVGELLYAQASLSHHPWYPQFIEGQGTTATAERHPSTDKQCLAWAAFDLGVGSPRHYRQLVSRHTPTADTVVVVARSITAGPPLPETAKLAYTFSPNGEVLHFANGLLHWHHICCTPGAGLLPGPADRWLMNTLRWLGLDQAERRTYTNEALAMCDWLQAPDRDLPARRLE
ncbi:MAG: hypothetical protein HRT76_09345 [Halieaceae bacterium]|nr:hypothetical protein [Halieaceae bacterium]